MNTQEFYKKLKSQNREELRKEAVRKVEPLFLQRNREQMYSGINTDGGKITPDYLSGRYALKKRMTNPKPGYGTPDLRLTGRFYSTLRLIFSGSTIHIKSPVSYADQLIGRYNNVLGLTQKNLAEIRAAATREFVNLLKI